MPAGVATPPYDLGRPHIRPPTSAQLVQSQTDSDGPILTGPVYDPRVADINSLPLPTLAGRGQVDRPVRWPKSLCPQGVGAIWNGTRPILPWRPASAKVDPATVTESRSSPGGKRIAMRRYLVLSVLSACLLVLASGAAALAGASTYYAGKNSQRPKAPVHRGPHCKRPEVRPDLH